MLGMIAMGRFNLKWDAIARPLLTASNWFYSLGTDEGGLIMSLRGKDADGKTREVRYGLYAGSGEGPYIPTLASVLLVRKLARYGTSRNIAPFSSSLAGQTAVSGSSSHPLSSMAGPGRPLPVGAYPCAGLLALREFEDVFREFDYDVHPYSWPALEEVPLATVPPQPSPAVPASERVAGASRVDMQSQAPASTSSRKVTPAAVSGTTKPSAETKPAISGFEMAFGCNNTARLPKFMREFHTAPGGVVRGTLTVTGGSNWLARLLARIGGLPRAASNVPVVVTSINGVWTRYFGPAAVAVYEAQTAATADTKDPSVLKRLRAAVRSGDILSSSWGYSGTLATEHFFPFRFGFQLKPLHIADGQLGFAHIAKEMRVLGVPVYRPLIMRPDGATTPLPISEGNGWHVVVDVQLPLVGRLVRYEGRVLEEVSTASGSNS